jgi:PKD repeat protein
MKKITQKISLIFTLLCLVSASLKAQCVAGLNYTAQQFNGIVYFYDYSTATLGDTIHSYNWNFGDGFTSTQKNPIHAYGTAGLYTVTLYVTDGSSTDGEVTQILMTVPYPASCIAYCGYTEGTPSLNNYPFSFIDGSTLADNATITSVLWDFGDGSTSTLFAPTHTYTTAGSYSVSYTITTSAGCTSTWGVTAEANLCPASLIDSITADPNNTAIFTAYTSGTAPYTFDWYYFPNGTYNTTPVDPADISNGGATVHAHELVNCAAYRVNVTDANGCTTFNWGMSICFAAPLNIYANFVSLQQGNSKTVDFSDITTMDGGYQTTRVWDFGDGTTSTLPMPTHTYANYGSYAVTLIASYPGAITDTAVQNINISPCNYNFAVTVTPSSTTVLSASATGGVGSLAYTWTNATSGNVIGNSPALVVNEAGLYAVSVSDDNGCLASHSAVAYSPHFQDSCNADFSFGVGYSGPQDSSLVFISSELYWGLLTNPHTYTWTFSDGYAAGQDPSVIRPFPMPNSFDITLTVTGSNCNASVTRTVYNDNSNCDLSPAMFFSNSGIWGQYYPLPINATTWSGVAPYTYLWDDGSTASTIYAYQTGTYCVTVTDGNGCTVNQCFNYFTNQGTNITLCGNLFADTNNNGIQDNGELPYSGTNIVTATNGTNTYNATVNGSGFYSMMVPSGNYTISYSIPNGSLFSTPASTDTIAFYNNILATPNTNNCGFNFGISNNTSILAGKLFYDNNSNGILDSAEFGIAYQPITAGIYTVFTDSLGNFLMNVVANNYNLSYTPQNAFSNYTLTTPGIINIDASVPGNIFLNNNFGIETSNFGVDLGIDLWPTTEVNNGFPAFYTIGYYNHGPTSANNTIVMTYDTSLTYVNSTLQGAMVDAAAHTVTWNVPIISSFTNNYLYIEFVASVALTMNSPVTCTATINNASNSDVNTGNNTSVLNQLSVSSYDPNDKRSMRTNNDHPMEQVISSINNDQEIEYMIRFQNIGNASAVNVRIVDEMSSLLDADSYVLLGGSHNCQVTRLGHTVTYKFDNIMLPCEADAGEASNGFVTFKIKALDSLPVGALISDMANIYFDFNPPIATNYANILMVDPTVISDSHNIAILNNNLGVFPNPITNTGIVKFSLEEDAQVKMNINELNGKNVLSKVINCKKGLNYVNIEAADFHSGLYLLNLITPESNQVHKINIISEK